MMVLGLCLGCKIALSTASESVLVAPATYKRGTGTCACVCAPLVNCLRVSAGGTSHLQEGHRNLCLRMCPSCQLPPSQCWWHQPPTRGAPELVLAYVPLLSTASESVLVAPATDKRGTGTGACVCAPLVDAYI